MQKNISRNHCVLCSKGKSVFKCEGCSKDFCYNHFLNHREQLTQQLDQLEINRDLLRQQLTEEQTEPQKYASSLRHQIDKWESNSIQIIQRIAEETRQIIIKHSEEHRTQVERQLNQLTDQLRQCRQKDDFLESDLQQWKQELTKLSSQSNTLSTITVKEDLTSPVTTIVVDLLKNKPKINHTTKWRQDSFIVAGGNGKGNGFNQLDCPFGMYVDHDETVYVADLENNRIVEWKCGATSGQIVGGSHRKENEIYELNHPIDVIIDKERNNLIICDQSNKRIVRWPRRNGTSGEVIISNIDCCRLTTDNNGYLYVSDYQKHEVRRWKMNGTGGTLVAGGNGKGNRLNQLSCPTFIFVDEDHSIYISDRNNHRVMKWIKGAKEGIVVAGGYGQGNGLKQLSRPEGLIVDHMGTVYVADYDNHRVMRWLKGATQGSIVIGNGLQLTYPTDIAFDGQGNLYVTNFANHQVQRFNIDGN